MRTYFISFLLAMAACAGPSVSDGTIMTMYFSGDGVMATSYITDDGRIEGVLEDLSGLPLATVSIDPASREWRWAMGGGAEMTAFTSDVIEPTLAAANVADYVMWLRARNARPGTPGDTTYADTEACVELASSQGQCGSLRACELWCESLPPSP